MSDIQKTEVETNETVIKQLLSNSKPKPLSKENRIYQIQAEKKEMEEKARIVLLSILSTDEMEPLSEEQIMTLRSQFNIMQSYIKILELRILQQ